MAQLLAVARFTHSSGMLKDEVVNTFAFLTPTLAPVDAEMTTVMDAVHGFYTDTQAITNVSVSTWMGSQMEKTGTPLLIEMYNLAGHLDGTAHGSPIKTGLYSVPAAAFTNPGLPSEMAVCCSFHTAYATDPEFAGNTRPRARDRGRIYIGPMATTAVDYDTAARPNVKETVRSTIASAAINLRDAAGHAWCVWSRSKSTLEPIVAGWVDDAWDVQRRRGQDPTERWNW